MKIPICITCFCLALAGCNLEEINENPNVPLEVPFSTLLPPAQKGLADVHGGRIYRYTGIFAQQLTGVDRQELLAENYQPDELFVGNVWSDIYVNAMINMRILIDRGTEEQSPHYTGVARVLMAQSIGILTDVWGDVPYTQALQGAEFPNPVYDSQEALYAEIQSLLDQAILDLSLTESVFKPGVDDIIYGGDIQAWRAAAHLLKARYHIHTTNRFPQAAQFALDALTGAISSPAQDFQYNYLGAGEDINPLSSFYQITPDTDIDPQFIELLELLDDPRQSLMFRNIPFSGGRMRPGNFFAAPAAPVKMGSYLEMLYIKAEAAYRTGDQTGAQTALEEAVTLSMNQVSSGSISAEDLSAYLSTNVQLTGVFETDIQTILTQKYIGMFTTPEPWTDFRRTGYPELEPNPVGATSSNPSGEIPRRLIYPQSERLRNTNFPQPAPNMQTRFWWDLN